jgi:hypothetical protein
MKKILILLAASVIIVTMAGSALASPFTPGLYYDKGGTSPVTNPINLAPGESIQVYFGGTQFNPNYINKQYTWTKGVTGASTGDTTQLTINIPSTNYFVPDNAASYIDPDPITISLAQSAPVGATYSFDLGATYADSSGIYDNGVVSRIVKAIPEFPTLAAPIAGIIGLLFVFGRKKEDI